MLVVLVGWVEVVEDELAGLAGCEADVVGQPVEGGSGDVGVEADHGVRPGWGVGAEIVDGLADQFAGVGVSCGVEAAQDVEQCWGGAGHAGRALLVLVAMRAWVMRQDWPVKLTRWPWWAIRSIMAAAIWSSVSTAPQWEKAWLVVMTTERVS